MNLKRHNNARGFHVDLVHLHGMPFLMPTNDNLYDRFVPKQWKSRSFAPPQQLLPIAPPVDVFGALISTLADMGELEFTVYDFGSWVGDFGIWLAKLAQMHGLKPLVTCVDPSDPALLTMANAHLNGLGDSVRWIDRALAQTEGPVEFATVQGHTDSARVANQGSSLRGVMLEQHDSVSIEEVFDGRHLGRNSLVKFDIEGMDALFFAEHERYQDASVVVEFVPTDAPWKRFLDLQGFQAWNETHLLFDICYAPNPTRLVRIDGDYEIFASHVAGRPFGYTDVLALPRSTDFSGLVTALEKPEPLSLPLSYMLT